MCQRNRPLKKNSAMSVYRTAQILILRGVLPWEVTDRVVRLISFHGKIREIGMLGKVISAILEVVDHVGGR